MLKCKEITGGIMRTAVRSMTVGRKCGCGTIHLTIDYGDDLKPVMIHMTLGKSGGCASAQLQALQGSLNERLTKGDDISFIFDQNNDNSWLNIRCSQIQTEVESEYSEVDKSDVHSYSCPDTIAKMIRYLLGKIEQEKKGGKK